MASFFILSLLAGPTLACLPGLGGSGGGCCQSSQPACTNPCGGSSGYATSQGAYPRAPVGYAAPPPPPPPAPIGAGFGGAYADPAQGAIGGQLGGYAGASQAAIGGQQGGYAGASQAAIGGQQGGYAGASQAAIGGQQGGYAGASQGAIGGEQGGYSGAAPAAIGAQGGYNQVPAGINGGFTSQQQAGTIAPSATAGGYGGETEAVVVETTNTETVATSQGGSYGEENAVATEESNGEQKVEEGEVVSVATAAPQPTYENVNTDPLPVIAETEAPYAPTDAAPIEVAHTTEYAIQVTEAAPEQVYDEQEASQEEEVIEVVEQPEPAYTTIAPSVAPAQTFTNEEQKPGYEQTAPAAEVKEASYDDEESEPQGGYEATESPAKTNDGYRTH